MKLKILVLLAFKILVITSCEQNESKVFTLEGEFEGSNTKYLILQYTDSLDNYLSDTIKIENKKFFIERHLKGTQLVSLTSNLTGRNMEDPNRLMFFLEPEKININLKEGHFPEAEISGSTTQLENENLNELIKPFFKKMDNLGRDRQKLIDEKKNTDNDNLDKQIDSITSRWQQLLAEIKNIRLTYAVKHNNSYLSADIISFYGKTLSKDSLEIFYNNFTPKIKESSDGKKIKELIALRVVDSGDSAPNFTGLDMKGEKISLVKFKGKTVLIDFMAGWCIPCIKNHPKLKSIYKDHHSKGLEIVSVSFDKDKESWKENVLKEDLNWHHIFQGLDNIGKEGTISKLYSVQPIPAYILIDEKGIIINRYGGADRNNKNLKDLEKDLNQIFSENKP